VGPVKNAVEVQEREQRLARFDDERESVGQAIARPAVELHPVAFLVGDDAQAIVLDFM
jgi:hypothetical protein